MIELPVDELGLEILRYAVEASEWNAHSWVAGAKQHLHYGQPAIRATEEAWSWLIANGLVAYDMSQQSAMYSIFVTTSRPSGPEGGADDGQSAPAACSRPPPIP